MQQLDKDEIVISGISGKFPESDNIEEFVTHLFSGHDMVTDDPRRWPSGFQGLPTRGGKLKELSKFDADFFKVHAKQAHVMDPQLRIMLELTHESLIDAGVNPVTLRGSKTGVFIGVSIGEAEEAWSSGPSDKVNGYALLGGSRSMLANRISFAFDLKGPSYAVDTACSSSLLALENAVSAIRSGKCDSAIVGGSNLTLKANRSIEFNRLKMLSPEGKCKSFDKDSNGYVRSEAIAIIYIQKRSTALRSYASILHIKTNTDGYKEKGITYPSSALQEQLLRETYREAGISPQDVTYIEAHGTGTKAGDKEECQALTRVFRPNPDKNPGLLIGSVKSNMGHSEPTSGLCSVVKVLMAYKYGEIPENLHFHEANPEIPGLRDGRLKVVDKNVKWTPGIVGVSSFGFGGSNVHLILQPNNRTKSQKLSFAAPDLDLDLNHKGPVLVPFSGRTSKSVEYAVTKLQEEYGRNPANIEEMVALLHKIHHLDIPGHLYRGYTFISPQVKGQATVEVAGLRSQTTTATPETWFIFPGMGSQSTKVGALMSIKTFRDSVERSARALEPYGFDLRNVIMAGEESKAETDILEASVSITAVQVAIVDLLLDLNISPQGIIGHSVGEVACGYADGCFTAEQAVLVAYRRGKVAQESNFIEGAMASVGMSWEKAKNFISSHYSKYGPIDVACHNAEDNVTVSGPFDLMKEFVADLNKRGIFAAMVDTLGIPFHSRYVVPFRNAVKETLAPLIPVDSPQRTKRWLSTSLPEAEWESPICKRASPEYYALNFSSPVHFHPAIQKIPKGSVVIEIGPHCILSPLVKRSVGQESTVVNLINKNDGDPKSYLLRAVGQLFTSGLNPKIDQLYEPISFPTSSLTSMLASYVKWDHSESWDVPKFAVDDPTLKSLTTTSEVTETTIDLTSEEESFYWGHVIAGRTIFPAVGYILAVWKEFARLRKVADFYDLPVTFKNVVLSRATFLEEGSTTVKFFINILEGENGGSFILQEGGITVCTGLIKLLENRPHFNSNLNFNSPNPEQRSTLLLKSKDIYKELRLRGYTYDGIFEGIRTMETRKRWCTLTWKNNWVGHLDSLVQFNILGQTDTEHRALVLPSSIDTLSIHPLILAEYVDVNASNIPANHLKNLGIVRSPGIEIVGLKTQSVKRWQQARADAQAQTVLKEKVVFIPYFDQPMKAGTSQEEWSLLDEKSALRFCLHVVTENKVKSSLGSLTLKVVHILKDQTIRNGDNKMTEVVTNIIEGQPGWACDLRVTNVDQNAPDLLKDVQLLLVDSEGMSRINPENFSSLGESSFVLLYGPGSFNPETLQDFQLVAQKFVTTKYQFSLLQKIRSTQNETKNIYIRVKSTDETFAWVEEIKSRISTTTLPRLKNVPLIVNLVSLDDPSSGILGLFRCLQREPSIPCEIRCFLIAKSVDMGLDKHSSNSEIGLWLGKSVTNNLAVNVLDEFGHWGSLAHFPLSIESPDSKNYMERECEHAYINSARPGDLSSFQYIQSPLKYRDPSDLCTVYYAALNFRDIMLATNKLNLSAIPRFAKIMDWPLGIEFAGLQKDETGKIRRIMGSVDYRGLSTTVVPDKYFTWAVPDSWSLSEASSVVIAYMTAYYALVVRGRIQPGSSILIHSGAGGVGMAAISVALSMNCKVFTTVSSTEKRRFLQKEFPVLPDSCFASSRDSSSFEEMIWRETEGKGVDAVLNSLAGEKLEASLRCLKERGKFFEIGKVDLSANSPLKMGLFLKDITFYGITIDSLFEEDTVEKRELVEAVSKGIAFGVVRPLPFQIYSSNLESVEQAFRYMASGKHLGKVLIEFKTESTSNTPTSALSPCMVVASARSFFDPRKSYIVVGGLGGLGFELCGWLIARGVSKLVVVSRSGTTNGYQDYYLERWRDHGVKVIISTENVVNVEGARKLLEATISDLGPIGGIFNCAMILKDGLFSSQTVETFESVSRPKLEATRALDQASRSLAPKSLDYFVVFSSISSGRGNAGQTSYGWANAGMEQICMERKAKGFPALAIQWGPMADVGVLENYDFDRKAIVGGIAKGQRLSSFLETLDTFLCGQSKWDFAVVASSVRVKKQKVGPNSGPGNSSQGTSKTESENKKNLAEQIRSSLGIKPGTKVNGDLTLVELGMDSLLASEVKQTLEKTLNRTVQADQISKMTFSQLSQLQ